VKSTAVWQFTTAPLNNTIETDIDGYQCILISELTDDTLTVYREFEH